VGSVGKAWSAVSSGCVSGDELASAKLCRKVAVVARVCMLNKVIIVIGGLKQEHKCICAVHISGEHVEPAHHPDAEG